uniref:Probable polyketide synthase 19 n=1 Tax=Dermatophagoides pteronyssinus TaxID=6956 RepID=A0A6P6XPY8_DERPT|nr:probable polyketide synthase 19 [Dermatophagoides pteronyssinus]
MISEYYHPTFVFHAAGILIDKAYKTLTKSDIEQVYFAKYKTCVNLHKILDMAQVSNDVKLFVCFSSISGLLGNYGQANYAAANAALDKFAYWRERRYKNKTMSIQWGPWREQGMASKLSIDTVSMGLYGLSNDLGFSVLYDLMMKKLNSADDDIGSVVCVQQFKWNVFLERYIKKPFFFDEISINESVEESEMDAFIKEKLSEMSREERLEYIKSLVLSTASNVLDYNDVPDLDTPLQELGISSLGAVEFRNALQKKLGVRLSISAMFDYPTLRSLQGYLIEQVEEKIAGTQAQIKVQLPTFNTTDKNNEVVITSLACRFPNYCRNGTDFWNMLSKNVNCIVDIPYTRWKSEILLSGDNTEKGKYYVDKGAFMTRIEEFDNKFFNISETEVYCLDPQQRILLEVSYEALKNVSFEKSSLTGSSTGVYIGCCNNDWHFLDTAKAGDNITSFSSSGGASSLLSNRISYAFGLGGPSFTVDTACSSSLVALDSANHSIKSGICDLAIVGGINLILTPHLYILFCKSRMLSPDGYCYTFDSRANGYVRGEGCGVVLLSTRAYAKENNLPVYATIKGSAVNHNGKSVSITAPNGKAQQSVILTALSMSQYAASDIDYIEAHGTGTSLGDPIEFNSLKEVFKGDRKSPLYIGALKTNIGHLEGAAGIAGLIKAIYVLQNKLIPRNLNFQSLNTYIEELDAFDYVLPSNENLRLPDKQKLIAGISSFGFGGTNAHVIIDVDKSTKFISILQGESMSNPTEKNIVFMFTGQGSQKYYMGKQLYTNGCEATKNIFQYSQTLLKEFEEYKDLDLYEVMFNKSELINKTMYSQILIFIYELALVTELKHRGINPTIVVGHSLGEYCASCAIGLISFEDAFKMVAFRAITMSKLSTQNGAMYAVRATENTLLPSLNNCKTVSIAAYNGTKSLVLSGDETEILDIIKKLNLQSQRLNVSNAFHSKLMNDNVPLLKNFITINTKFNDNISCKFVSTVTGEEVNLQTISQPSYWAEHIIKPVKFIQAINYILNNEYDCVFIEIGPSAMLSNLVLTKSKELDHENQALSSADQENIKPQNQQKIFSLQNREGDDDEIKNLKKIKAELRYDIEVNWNHKSYYWYDCSHPLVGLVKSGMSKKFNNIVNQKTVDYFNDHVVNKMPLVPGAAIIDVFAVLNIRHLNENFYTDPLRQDSYWSKINSIILEQPIVLPGSKNEQLDIQVQMSNNNIFNIFSTTYGHDFVLNARAADFSRISKIELKDYLQEKKNQFSNYMELYNNKDKVTVNTDTLYEFLSSIRLEYGTNFRTIKSLIHCGYESIAQLSFNAENLINDSTIFNFKLLPGIVDGAFQALASCLARSGYRNAMVPVKFENILSNSISPCLLYYSYSKIIEKSKKSVVAYISIYDKDGNLCLEIERLTLQAIRINHNIIPIDIFWTENYQKLTSFSQSEGISFTENFTEIENNSSNIQHTETDLVTNNNMSSAINQDNLNVLVLSSNNSENNINVNEINKSWKCSFRLIPKNDIEADILLREKSWDIIMLLDGLDQIDNSLDYLENLLTVTKAYSRQNQNSSNKSALPYLLILFTNKDNENLHLSHDNTGALGFIRSARVELDNIINSKPKIKFINLDLFSTLCLEDQLSKILLRNDFDIEDDFIWQFNDLFTIKLNKKTIPYPAGYYNLELDLNENKQLIVNPTTSYLPNEIPFSENTYVIRSLGFVADGKDEIVSFIEHSNDVSHISTLAVLGVIVKVNTLNNSDSNLGRWCIVNSSSPFEQFFIHSANEVKLIDNNDENQEVTDFLECSNIEYINFDYDLSTLFYKEKKTLFLWPNLTCDIKNTTKFASLNNRCIIITGGHGALGLELAKFLIEDGVRIIYLLSRTGSPKNALLASETYTYLSKIEANIHNIKCDVSDKKQIETLLKDIMSKNHILMGVFLCSGVTEDYPLANQQKSHLVSTYNSKALPALHFDKLLTEYNLEKNLRYFVCFSSISALIGSYNQVNYAAANSVLDDLCVRRKNNNKRALSIQWGPWSEQGMAKSLVTLIEKSGLKCISNAVGMRILYALLMLNHNGNTEVKLVVQQFIWGRFFRRYTSTPSFYNNIPSNMILNTDSTDLIDLKSTPRETLLALLAEIAQKVSGSDIILTANMSLFDMQFDSLGAVEFRNNVLELTGVRLAQSLAFENPTLNDIVDYIYANAGITNTNANAKIESSKTESIDQWLINALDPESERYLLYIDKFMAEFSSLNEIIQHTNFEEILVTKLNVDNAKDLKKLLNYHSDYKKAHEALLADSGYNLDDVHTSGQKVPHPLEDKADLEARIDFDLSIIKPMTNTKDIKHVFLTGATGFVGRCQIHSLVNSVTHPNLKIYCLVRAENASHGLARIKKMCEEADLWRDHYADYIVPIPGDLTVEKFGLTDKVYQDLASKIDLIYHTGGDVNLLCNYSKIRSVNTLSIEYIIDFATTKKLKPVNYTSTLGQYPDLFAFFTNEFSDRYLYEDTSPIIEEMETFFPPQRQGYPWSKWVAEMVLRKAREKGLPVYIYRLPNMYCAYRTGYTNRTDYATALMISSILEGKFPESSAFAALTPVDIVADMVCEGGLLDANTRKHWLYNLIDTRVVKEQQGGESRQANTHCIKPKSRH